MNKQDITILGISPGTQHYGIAVLRNGRLKDRRVKNFLEAWSLKKLNNIQKVIRGYLEKYDISAIALKTPFPYKTSDSYILVEDAIKKLADQNNIKLYFYSIEELERYYSGEKKVNKETLMAGVLEEFPEMTFEHRKEQQRKMPYYVKAFEAIAVARLCTDEIK